MVPLAVEDLTMEEMLVVELMELVGAKSWRWRRRRDNRQGPDGPDGPDGPFGCALLQRDGEKKKV